MANTTSTLLQIVNLEEGANDNTWGQIADTNWLYLENAIANAGAISSTGGTTTLTATEARDGIIVFSGTLISDHTVVVPSTSKWWIVRNTHVVGAYALKVKTSAGSAVSIPATPVTTLVYCDGSAIHLVGSTNEIPNAALATMATLTVKANVTGGTATPTDVTMAALGAALGYLPAPTGTKMLFQQTAAPTGWTKITTTDNAALRVVSGTVSSGGTVNFTTAFASQGVAGTNTGTAITEAQMPLHGHPFRYSSVTAATANSTTTGGVMLNTAGAGNAVAFTGTPAATLGEQIGGTGGGATHTHTFTGTAIDLAVKYIDVIICSKD